MRFKALPAGWEFRRDVLDKDPPLVPERGVTTIMPGRFFNIYDKTGRGSSDCIP